ncbi:MAG: ATP-binding cassette domain-containing protein [Acidobacteria bacterium]|nr:ATP-binding cassette domain-containing protein [Acidobacteriota bacterium]
MMIVRFKLNYHGFHLHVDSHISGNRLAVLGPSGAGKTSLLRTVAGLTYPEQATIEYRGQLWHGGSSKWAPHQRSIAYVFQEPRLFPHLTARDNLTFAGALDDRVVEALGLESVLQKLPRHLSGGQQQRLSIGRALISRRRLLLLDEPFTGLDATHRASIMQFIDQWCVEHDMDMLITTHHMHELMYFTDQFLVITGSGPCFQGTMSELINHERCLPFLVRMGIQNSVLGEVIRQTVDHMEIDVSGQTFHAPGHAKCGTRMHLRFRAEDVMLLKGASASLSAQNQIRATILSIHPVDQVVLLTLDAGQPIYAEITPRALQQLKLKVGDTVTCLIKSTVVRLDHSCGSVTD